AAQNLLPAQILQGEETRGTTHFPAQGGICGERENGLMQRVQITRGDIDPASGDSFSKLGTGRSSRDHWPSAGEHTGEIRGHDESRGVFLLRQEMDIGGIHLLELRTEVAIAAKDKMQAGIVLQLVRELRQYFKTLFYAEISGVEQHDPVVADTKLAADLVWCVEGADGIDIDP